MKILRKQKQQGVSLLEVIVTLTIGIILLLAVSSVYITANRSSNERSTDETLDEAARQIFERLQYDLNNAGYVDAFDKNGSDINALKMAKLSDDEVSRNLGRFVAANNSTSSSSGGAGSSSSSGGATSAPKPITLYQAVYGIDQLPIEGSTDATTGDKLTVRYQVKPMNTQQGHSSLAENPQDGSTTDCLGKDVSRVTNKYSVVKHNFQCNGQPLVNNVHDFRLQYLITGPAQTTDLANSYSGLYVQGLVNAAGVNQSVLGWPGVTGVRVCVVIGGEPFDKRRRTEITQFQPNIPQCNNQTATRDSGDTKLYRRYIKTLVIPNLLYFTN